MEKLSRFIDRLSAFLAAYKGLLPLIGVVLILINFIIGITSNGFMAHSNLFLHLGIILAILGIMLGWAL
jgi:hypothetical protein